MGHYYFHLRDGDRRYADSSGVPLPSDEAAREHARRIAIDLMKNRESKARHWRLVVQDTPGETLFEVLFVTLDQTLSHLSLEHKTAMEELSRRCFALRETIAVARTVRNEAIALVAKSRGRPYVVAHHGEQILGGL